MATMNDMDDIEGGTWSRTSKAAGLDLRLSPAALRVLVVLGCYANQYGECHPSVATLANQLGLDRRQIQRHILKLTSLGYLSRAERRQRGRAQISNAYVLMYPPAPSLKAGEEGGTKLATPKRSNQTTWQKRPPAASDAAPPAASEGTPPRHQMPHKQAHITSPLNKVGHRDDGPLSEGKNGEKEEGVRQAEREPLSAEPHRSYRGPVSEIVVNKRTFPPPAEFGDWLRKTREERGLSPADLAALTDFDERGILDIEARRAVLSDHYRRRIFSRLASRQCDVAAVGGTP